LKQCQEFGRRIAEEVKIGGDVMWNEGEDIWKPVVRIEDS